MKDIERLHYNPALPTSCRICTANKINEMIDRINALSPNGLALLGYYASLDELLAAVPSPLPGDSYMVGANLYVYTGTGWEDCGQIKGKDGQDGQDGQDGEDGFSPVVNVSKVDKVTTITITDKTGTKTVDILDGEDGEDGEDGTGSGSGDMLKSVYDKDGDGIVDNANTLQGKAASAFALASHGHDDVYALLSHTHPGLYSSVNHNHDGVYSPLSHTHGAGEVSGLAPVATSGSYNDLTGKPNAYVLPVASETVLGGVKVSFDEATGILYINTVE